MQTTHISNKGQVLIPKSVRDACHLDLGQELEIEITAQGILLKAKKNLPKTTLDQVAGCLADRGVAKTLDEMDDAIRQATALKVLSRGCPTFRKIKPGM